MRIFKRIISAFLLVLTVGIAGVVVINTCSYIFGFNNSLTTLMNGAMNALDNAASGIVNAVYDIGEAAESLHSGGGPSGISKNPAIPVAPVTETPDSNAENTKQSSVSKPVAAEDLKSVWGKTGMDGLTVYEYGKSLLNNEERSAYCQIVDAVHNIKDSVTITSTLSPTNMKKVYQYFLYDHVEVFYIKGINLRYIERNTKTEYTFDFEYRYDKKNIPGMRKKYRTMALKILSAADGLSTDYKKEKAIHDKLIKWCSYDIKAAEDPTIYAHPDSFSAYGAFVNRKAVCVGYAQAMKLLLSSVGIKSLYVTGTANGGGHAWNEVQIGGKWYFVDATFDDPVYVDSNGNYLDRNTVSYTYFNFKSKKDHVLGKFNSSDPFAADSENYEVMP